MFELIIILSRYVFIFYILYFLYQGVRYIGAERSLIAKPKEAAASKQRIVIVFMHITAFLILAYIPGSLSFSTKTLLTGFAALIFLVLVYFLAGKIYKGGCDLMWNGVLFLADVGLIMLWRLEQNLAERQLVWLFLGFAAIFVMPAALKFIPQLEKLENVYMITGVMLLFTPFIFGREEFGAINWIRLGFMNLQPSEIVKFIFVFYLASVFRKKLSIKQMIIPFSVSALYVLILVLQRDLGGALIFFMTFMVVMYVSTSSEILFAAGMAAIGAASVLAYRMFSHVRVRIDMWRDPWVDVYDKGNQIVQALFAIGTWGTLGSGLTRGYPLYVPVVARDFIFAAICEEMGSVFGMGVIGVYIMIFYRGVHIALRSKRKYYSLLAFGFTAMMAFQTFLILGGTIKLIPLTGVTLPFISYGGSSVLVSSMMIGIIQWMLIYYRENKSNKTKPDDKI